MQVAFCGPDIARKGRQIGSLAVGRLPSNLPTSDKSLTADIDLGSDLRKSGKVREYCGFRRAARMRPAPSSLLVGFEENFNLASLRSCGKLIKNLSAWKPGAAFPLADDGLLNLKSLREFSLRPTSTETNSANGVTDGDPLANCKSRHISQFYAKG